MNPSHQYLWKDGRPWWVTTVTHNLPVEIVPEGSPSRSVERRREAPRSKVQPARSAAELVDEFIRKIEGR